MSTMAGEFSEVLENPFDYIEDLVRNFVVAVALAVSVAFGMERVLNPVLALFGWPHAVSGGFWAFTLLALGFFAVLRLLHYGLNVLRGRDDNGDMLNLATYLVTVGVAAWIISAYIA